VRNCTRDEGGPLGAGLQEQASDRLKLLWPKVVVVSVEEKAWQKTVSGMDQGDERKRTIYEVSKYQRRRQGVLADLQDKFRGNLFTAWAASGIKAT
jgi:hypothetical protein